MQHRSSTYELQAGLANYCRTGDITKVNGANNERVKHYRRLVFNVVLDSLSSAYPLTRQLIGQKNWDQLVDDFFSEHNCQSPSIWTMPKELYEYVVDSKHPFAYTYFVLEELLLFEWLEIQVYMQEDIPCSFLQRGDINENKLIINPESTLVHFNYPVHLKSAGDILQSDKSDYFCSIHRHPESGKVIFTNLSVALVRSLEILNEAPINLTNLSKRLSEELNIPDKSLIENNLLNFLVKALESKLILGYTSN